MRQLTEGEQELLRDETEYLLGSAADAIKAAKTAGEVDEGMRRFRVAGAMLAASETGNLPCDPDVLATITRTLEMLHQDITGHAKALAEFDEHGPAGYLDERLRSKLTVTEMLEDIAVTRKDVERPTRQQRCSPASWSARSALPRRRRDRGREQAQGVRLPAARPVQLLRRVPGAHNRPYCCSGAWRHKRPGQPHGLVRRLRRTEGRMAAVAVPAVPWVGRRAALTRC